MERYGEYLFGVSSGRIKQGMDDISENEVRDCSDFQVFKRGKEYYRSGLVERIEKNLPHTGKRYYKTIAKSISVEEEGNPDGIWRIGATLLKKID